MKRNMIEAILGAVVLAGAAIFLIFAYSVATVKSTGGYAVSIAFSMASVTLAVSPFWVSRALRKFG